MLFFSQIQKAYDKCFGEDYSFDDLADTVGRDSDNDDLPDEYEGTIFILIQASKPLCWKHTDVLCTSEKQYVYHKLVGGCICDRSARHATDGRCRATFEHA